MDDPCLPAEQPAIAATATTAAHATPITRVSLRTPLGYSGGPGRPGTTVSGREMAREESLGAVDLEHRHVHVAAGNGVQRLLRRAEGVEQRQPRLARDELVVPLELELDRDGDPGGRLRQGLVAHQA